MKPQHKLGGGPITSGAIIPNSAFMEGKMPSGQIYAAGGAVRGKSVGSDLKHWKEYAARNNKIPKGKTAENPGVPLSEPTHKAVGAKAKGRADRAYAKGGKVEKKPKYGWQWDETKGPAQNYGRTGIYGKLPEEKEEKTGGRVKRASGGKVTPKVVKGIGNKITAGSCTGVERVEATRRQPRFR